jgi:hypothetical protein
MSPSLHVQQGPLLEGEEFLQFAMPISKELDRQCATHLEMGGWNSGGALRSSPDDILDDLSKTMIPITPLLHRLSRSLCSFASV